MMIQRWIRHIILTRTPDFRRDLFAVLEFRRVLFRSAALYPADTKYMYFILSDKLDDSMSFSVTYKQFLKDKDAYYDARDKAEKDND